MAELALSLLLAPVLPLSLTLLLTPLDLTAALVHNLLGLTSLVWLWMRMAGSNCEGLTAVDDVGYVARCASDGIIWLACD